jgi:hypothetical protein
VTAVRRLAACLLVFGLVAHAGAGASLGAPDPSPKELWKLYPLDPTPQSTGTRPATTTAAARSSPAPRSGVAGASTTRRNAAVTTRTSGAAQHGSDDGGPPLSFGLLLGGLAAAILLLGLAALPVTAAPRLAGWRDDRRLDMALAGALALVVVTVVYLSGAL